MRRKMPAGWRGRWVGVRQPDLLRGTWIDERGGRRRDARRTDVEGAVLREDEEDDDQHVQLPGAPHAVRVVELRRRRRSAGVRVSRRQASASPLFRLLKGPTNLLEQGQEEQLHVAARQRGVQEEGVAHHERVEEQGRLLRSREWGGVKARQSANPSCPSRPHQPTHRLGLQALGQRRVELVEGHAQGAHSAVVAQQRLVVLLVAPCVRALNSVG